MIVFIIGIILNWFYSDHRKFRVIPAESFLRTFASDRSHMKKPNGEWIKTPPPYLPIRTPGTCVNWMMLAFSSWFLEMPVNMNWKHVHMFQYHRQDIHDFVWNECEATDSIKIKLVKWEISVSSSSMHLWGSDFSLATCRQSSNSSFMQGLLRIHSTLSFSGQIGFHSMMWLWPGSCFSWG